MFKYIKLVISIYTWYFYNQRFINNLMLIIHKRFVYYYNVINNTNYP